MAFSQGYVFGFAATVCVVCSLAIASLSLGLRDLQKANERRDEQGNILMALGLNDDGALSGPAIDETWEQRVEMVILEQATGEPAEGSEWDLNGDGAVNDADALVARERVKGTTQDPELLLVYRRTDDGQVAIPMYGQGLWGPISGYIALDAEGTTVTGTTFFAPKETPGLGAEIMEPRFEEQWEGKRIVAEDGTTTPIDVVKGQASALCADRLEHCVDGVSGATITARGVDVMVEKGLAMYDPYLSTLRGGAR